MGLFSFNANTKKDMNAAPKKSMQKTAAPKVAKKPVAKTQEAAAKKVPAAASVSAALSSHAELAAKTLISPRITEKASVLAEGNTYTFNIALSATKHDVKRAVQALYGVTPQKIAIVRTDGQAVVSRSRRQRGRTNKMKKAYVFLKKGETIDFA